MPLVSRRNAQFDRLRRPLHRFGTPGAKPKASTEKHRAYGCWLQVCLAGCSRGCGDSAEVGLGSLDMMRIAIL